MDAADTIGFIGLGEMGGRMARRLAGAGRALAVHDAAGAAARAPDGAAICESSSEVAARAETVLLSLPDGDAVRAVAAEVAAASRAGRSTIRPSARRRPKRSRGYSPGPASAISTRRSAAEPAARRRARSP